MEILKDINFVQALIAALLLYVGWTLRRALNKFEGSIKDLYEKYGAANARLTRVETVHDIKGCDNLGKKHD
ncbi:MAG: hypothetical protein KKH22_12055 [Proteobacteria bacterium]|nr:hypothetical protein [Pseudomonadota bacterium]